MSGRRRLEPVESIAPTATFPVRVSLTMSYDQSDDLDEIRIRENRKRRQRGLEQLHTRTGLLRAALAVVLDDPRLVEKMVTVAESPSVSGRGGIGHLQQTVTRGQST